METWVAVSWVISAMRLGTPRPYACSALIWGCDTIFQAVAISGHKGTSGGRGERSVFNFPPSRLKSQAPKLKDIYLGE